MDYDRLTANGYLNELHYVRRGFFMTNDVYYTLWVIDEDEIDHCLMLTEHELAKAMTYFPKMCDKALNRKTKKSLLESADEIEIGELFPVDVSNCGVKYVEYVAVNIIDSDSDEKHCLLFTQRKFKELEGRAKKNIDYIPKKSYKGSF